MKKYLVIYHAPAEAIAQMADATPEEMAAGMEPWMAWAEKCGEHLVDLGTPLAGGQRLSPDGSILQWTGGCEIEVHETMPLPGA